MSWSTDGLEVDESLLTGEADADRQGHRDQVLSGSFVSQAAVSTRPTVSDPTPMQLRLAGEAKKFTLVRSELRAESM